MAGTGAIVPDDKDWTWVLERPCPECGFDAGAIDPANVGDLVRANASAWQGVLSSPTVRDRPSPDRWSRLEYGCHVRDVFRVYLERLGLMLTEDGPHYPNWDQDATAVEDDYPSQSPVAVAVALTQAATALADRFEGTTRSTTSVTCGMPDRLSRPGSTARRCSGPGPGVG